MTGTEASGFEFICWFVSGSLESLDLVVASCGFGCDCVLMCVGPIFARVWALYQSRGLGSREPVSWTPLAKVSGAVGARDLCL